MAGGGTEGRDAVTRGRVGRAEGNLQPLRMFLAGFPSFLAGSVETRVLFSASKAEAP